MVTVKFATRSKDDAMMWYNKLKRLCQVASIHISRDYSVGKMSGMGNFYKLYNATHNETGTLCTIKTVSKERLMERQKILVRMLNFILNSKPQ